MLAVAVAGLLACRGNSNSTAATPAAGSVRTATNAARPQTTVTSPAGPAAADAIPPTVPAAEASYLKEALTRGMGEVELAVAVSQRTQNPAVKDVTRSVIESTDRTDAELAKLASAASVTLPNNVAASAVAEKARFSKLQGRTLDATYLAQVLRDYEALRDLHRSTATRLEDMRAKQAAVIAASDCDAMIEQARSAYAQVTGTAPPPQPKRGSVAPASGGRTR